jgi:2-amino-4-hydroxy-6-hydroxymethyldihydropteridine diphosphokinase
MKAVISLGANIGDPKANLDLAVGLLREATEVIAVSSYLQTKPVGGPEQPDYLNAVAILESDLPAKDLLALLNGIETAMGRTREIHWGPRVIDLDLIQYGGLLVKDERLTLPHPRAHERRFVFGTLV